MKELFRFVTIKPLQKGLLTIVVTLLMLTQTGVVARETSGISISSSETTVESYDPTGKNWLLLAASYTEDCREMMIAGNVGRSPWKGNAKRNARIKWRWAVRRTATLGESYTNWGWAREKSYHCRKRLGTWRCSARAFPCARF
jgi:hypothetical protein